MGLPWWIQGIWKRGLLSDQPPSASLADLTGVRDGRSIDEHSILRDIGERSSFAFELMGEFDVGILTSGGIDRLLATAAASGEVTDNDSDEGIIVSMEGTSESGGNK